MALSSVNLASNSSVGGSGAISFGSSISGTGGMTKVGTNTVTLTSNSSYSGGTTISSGTVMVSNTGGASYPAPSTTSRTVTATNSGTATGTGAVTVNSGGTMAGTGTVATSNGVTVNAGGSLVSGGVQSGTTAGQGLTINNTAVSITGSTAGGAGATHTALNSANLTFDLGAGGTTAATVNNPNTNSTYLSLAGSSSINFTGHTSISLVDLTNGGLTALRVNSPYLLIQASSDSAYTGLVTMNDGVLSLDQNGVVVGVYVSGTGQSMVYDPINLIQYGPDGVTPLSTSSSNNAYLAPYLYLNNGDLEVVPEPGTWALMIGGLATLVFLQRRRRNS